MDTLLLISEDYEYLIGFIKENYYSVILFSVIFLQEHIKDLLSTVACFLMSYLSLITIKYFMTLGYDFYTSAMFYEALFFSASIFLLGSKVGVILYITTFTGFMFNFVGSIMPEGDFYFWYKDSYGLLNIILFEVLIWGCIANSRLKPYLIKMNNNIEEYLHKRRTNL